MGVGKVDSLLWKVETRGVEGRGWLVCKIGNKGSSSVRTADCNFIIII